MYQDVVLGGGDDLPDDEFVRAFESLALPAESFRHVDHVRLAFLYLKRFGLLETLGRYRDGLRHFAAHHGAPEKYHETVTFGLVIMIHERLASCAVASSWASFACENEDLLRWRDGLFFEHYGPDVLESEVARRSFVLPGSPR